MNIKMSFNVVFRCAVYKDISKNECYNDNCPDNSSPNNNNICLCSFNFYYDNTNDLFTCLGNEELCKDKGYPFNEFNGKECFKNKNECNIKNDNKGKKYLIMNAILMDVQIIQMIIIMMVFVSANINIMF